MSGLLCFFFFSSRRRHTRSLRDWSSDVCSSDLTEPANRFLERLQQARGANLGDLGEEKRTAHGKLGRQGPVPFPHARLVQPLDGVARGALPGRPLPRLAHLCVLDVQLQQARAPETCLGGGQLPEPADPFLVHPGAGPGQLQSGSWPIAAPLERKVSRCRPRRFAPHPAALDERDGQLLAGERVRDGEADHAAADHDGVGGSPHGPTFRAARQKAGVACVTVRRYFAPSKSSVLLMPRWKDRYASLLSRGLNSAMMPLAALAPSQSMSTAMRA